MNKPSSSTSGNQVRFYDNDWLTVLAMLMVFVFHCARFFNDEDWHVKNNSLSEGMSLLVSIVGQWIMPLFFLLSGMSSSYSLNGRSKGRYLGNRVRRLVLPLLFATFVVLIPLQVWIERVSHGQFAGSFLDFYPHYFEGFYAFGGNFAWMGLHLWYLEVLFVFTLLTFPFFVLMKNSGVEGFVSRATSFSLRHGALFLLGLPLFGVELLVNTQRDGIGMRAFGGWSLLSYLTIFAIGFVMAGEPGYRKALERNRFIALALALLATGLMFFAHIDLSPLGDTLKYAVRVFVRSFNSWFWLAAMLGFGSRHLNFGNSFLLYAREAVLPFYILHQTVIVFVGYYIADWRAGVLLKYFVLSSVSFVAVVLLYELCVRRIGVLRYLFGMKMGIRTAGT